MCCWPSTDRTHAARAVQQLMTIRDALRDPTGVDLHLVNVQRSLPGDVSNFVDIKARDEFHRERSDAALAPARALLDAAGYRYEVHRKVGEPGATIAALANTLGADLIVMGTRGLGTHTGALLGSVAQSTLEHAGVPVLLTK